MNKLLIYFILILTQLDLSIGFSQQVNDSIIKTITESLPLFRVKGNYQIEIKRNSEIELQKFLNNNIKFPETAVFDEIDGKVIIQYTVTQTGEIKNAKVVKKLRPDFDDEALRVINLLPKYERPGMQNGKPVDVIMTIPVIFYNDKKMIREEKRKRKNK